MIRIALVALLVAGCSACGGGAKKRTYPDPPAADLVTYLRETRGRAETLRADTKADAWVGNDRAKVTVNILAEWGGKFRFQAENPNQSTAADLASDGEQYCFLDANKNCGECGPATPESVGRLLGLALAPDDLFFVLLGSTPVLEGEATVSWDAGDGEEVLTIVAPNGYKQKVQLEAASGGGWDVRTSELWGPDGKRIFKIRHTDFHAVTRPNGKIVRLPGKSELEQTKESVLIDWRKQELDVDNPDAAFRIELQPGLRTCQ